MDFEDSLVAELTAAHGAHTVILYGSLARGDATSESDADVAAYTDGVTAIMRDARPWHGRFLDAFAYPTAALAAPLDADALKFLHARVLFDARGLAGPWLERVAAFWTAGPAPLASDDAQMRRVWARKMLARIGRGDLEAQYRHHWLLFQLLEDYFALRTTWYLGPKLALAELAHSDPATHAAFVAALAPGAPPAALASLVECVVGAA